MSALVKGGISRSLTISSASTRPSAVPSRPAFTGGSGRTWSRTILSASATLNIGPDCIRRGRYAASGLQRLRPDVAIAALQLEEAIRCAAVYLQGDAAFVEPLLVV